MSGSTTGGTSASDGFICGGDRTRQRQQYRRQRRRKKRQSKRRRRLSQKRKNLQKPTTRADSPNGAKSGKESAKTASALQTEESAKIGVPPTVTKSSSRHPWLQESSGTTSRPGSDRVLRRDVRPRPTGSSGRRPPQHDRVLRDDVVRTTAATESH